jgi:hypothetical protein
MKRNKANTKAARLAKTGEAFGLSKYAAKQAQPLPRHPSRGTLADSQDAREFYEQSTTSCATCGVDTGSNDMLCDDCDAYQDADDAEQTADEEAQASGYFDDGYSDPNESHWAGEDRHYYNSER